MKSLRVYLSTVVFALLSGAVLAAPVNVNQASAQALADNLTGVGPAIARRIIDYRKANGPFKAVDDLAKVKGVGPATIERNRGDIKLSGSVTTGRSGK